MKRFDLSGKLAFVTGAGSGLGQAIAIALAEAGADVACFDLAGVLGQAETSAAIVAVGRKALVLDGDVTEPASIEAAFDRAERGAGEIDIAVNSAGIANVSPAEAMPRSQFLRMMDINLNGLFWSCQVEGRRMLARGRGSILNMASICGSTAVPGLEQAHYDATKAAVIRLTKSLAAEWSGRGVRVNCLSPGFMTTPMNCRPEVAENVRKFVDMTPMKRMGQPHEVGWPAVFLSSDAASYCTGVDLNIDGGFLSI
ncbi:SDR family oxidoreductase [Methylovirgula sp. 4M-Z18]|uniref:SDR family oxidoreductase n=1 Tax=Methylovirgula sp. 4M-Z18 TaxID=2293567 RepID=UPI000E2F9894|nr:SDR family oxidoreductase [Methylovirgula sp. 4M-Z18]RFB74950.1 SDR family oxidoreductase [Methylovirgula sp. 4M-Z18]